MLKNCFLNQFVKKDFKLYKKQKIISGGASLFRVCYQRGYISARAILKKRYQTSISLSLKAKEEENETKNSILVQTV